MKKLPYLLMVTLASCAAHADNADHSFASPSPPGSAALTGYLGYQGELLLYETRDDYKRGRYERCISGWSRNGDPNHGRLIYEGKLVRITGETFIYKMDSDPMAAMLATFKNNCASTLVFRADIIQVIG
jgi:hypothetical protein